MATVRKANRQSLAESRIHIFDFSPDLMDGVTVSSATASHTPPSGAASTGLTVTVDSPLVYVTLPEQTVIGVHRLTCLATLSDNELSDITLLIPFYH